MKFFSGIPFTFQSTEVTGLKIRCTSARSKLTDTLRTFYDNSIAVSSSECMQICKKTVKQSGSKEWHSERQKRVKASKAHIISKGRHPETRQKYFFSKSVDHQNLVFGRETEPKAKERYKELTSNCVIDVGLVIRSDQSWLSASPDGLFLNADGNLGVLEIKCPISCKDLPITVDYLDTNFHLKKSHSYYSQVQILMYVTGAKFCHFFIYSSVDSKLVIVNYDENFL